MSIFVADGTVRHEIYLLGTSLTHVQFDTTRPPAINLFHPWVERPPHRVATSTRGMAPLAHLVQRLIKMTGWSNRKVASAVGTSHPTIASILRGKEPDRVEGLTESIFRVTELIEGLWAICGRDRWRLSLAIQAPGSSGKNAYELITDGEYAKAYLLALDAARGGRPQGRLIAPSSRRVPSKETSLLGDDDG